MSASHIYHHEVKNENAWIHMLFPCSGEVHENLDSLHVSRSSFLALSMPSTTSSLSLAAFSIGRPHSIPLSASLDSLV